MPLEWRLVRELLERWDSILRLPLLRSFRLLRFFPRAEIKFAAYPKKCREQADPSEARPKRTSPKRYFDPARSRFSRYWPAKPDKQESQRCGSVRKQSREPSICAQLLPRNRREPRAFRCS